MNNQGSRVERGDTERADQLFGAAGKASRIVPRLLAFYVDAVGWEPIAWGLRFADGSAMSVSFESPPAVRLWANLGQAEDGLNAWVDTAEPRAKLPASPGQMLGDVTPGPSSPVSDRGDDGRSVPERPSPTSQDRPSHP